MSNFFGIVKFNKEPVLKEELLQMQDAMKNSHTEVNQIYCDGSVGFGHMQINSSPEAKYEKLPAISPCGKYLFTAYARLDYRNELANKLGLALEEMCTVPDTTLVLMAYLKWKYDCVHHLLGDWIFAAYNKKENELFIAKDHSGNSGIYCSRYKDYFCFATSIKGILSCKWVNKELDRNTIISLITAGRRHHTHQTIYKNIFTVKAAHYLLVNNDKAFNQIQYWNTMDIEPVRYKKEDEYMEYFLSLYQEAISSRLRTPSDVGILLSSGLDSSSVAAIAAPMLKKQDKTLFSYTSVPFYKDLIPEHYLNQADESLNVEKIAAYIGNIDTSFVDAKGYSPLNSLIYRSESMGHLVNISYNSYWMQNIVDQANKKGIRRMFTGQNGNHTISWDGSYHILHLLQSGELKKSFKEISDWSHYNGTSNYKAIKRLVASPVKQRCNAYLNRLLKKRNYSLFDETAISRDVIKNIDISEIFKNLDYIPGYTIESNPELLRQRLFTSQITEVGLMYNELRVTSGIEFVDPTQDKRIIEFTFGLPYSLWISKGVTRYLIRKSMEGKLPKEILKNRNRSQQAADVGMRLSQAPELESVFSVIKANQNIAKYIDLDKLSYHLNELKTDKSILRKKANAQYALYAFAAAWFLSEYEKKYVFSY